MTLRFGSYAISTIKGFDEKLWDAGWTVRRFLHRRRRFGYVWDLRLLLYRKPHVAIATFALKRATLLKWDATRDEGA